MRGTYVRNIITGQLVRIMGEVGGHESATHWGREYSGDGPVVLLNPKSGGWLVEPVGVVCLECGRHLSVPAAMHHCQPTDRLLHYVRHVVSFDWSGNDEDAVAAIDRLRDIVKGIDYASQR